MAKDKIAQQFDRVLLLEPDAFPPLAATVRAEFTARSWRPASRPENTDHYLVARFGRSQETLLTSLPPDGIGGRFDEQAYAMVVADGMGPAGEIASRLSVAALLRLALRFGRWQVRVDELVAPDIIERLMGHYRQIDSALVNVNRTEAGRPLHTTLTAVVTGGRDLFFAHVGHSRAYLFRRGELIQLTRDHTRAIQQRMATAQLIDLTNIASDLHHILTDALGARTVDPHIDIERITLDDADVLLVCTNGLTDAVGDREIVGILSSARTLDEQAAALIDAAAGAGADDDATVVLARYHVPE
jgi:PPM family protein phosphatase